MAKRRAQIRLLAIAVAALMVGHVGAETLVVSAARMLDVTNGGVALCRSDVKTPENMEIPGTAATSLSKV